MKRSIIGLVVVAAVGAGAAAYYMRDGEAVEGAAAKPSERQQRTRQAAGRAWRRLRRTRRVRRVRRRPRMPMTVELSTVKRGDVSMQIQVVGNLIGAGDRGGHAQSQRPARLGRGPPRRSRQRGAADREDRRPRIAGAAQAGGGVPRRRRRPPSDSATPTSSSPRSTAIATSNLYERQLISRQTYDDTEARYQAAEAQVDLAQAQLLAAKSRLDELKINLSNTTITSPVNGFVASRALDPGAWVTPNYRVPLARRHQPGSG